MQNRRRFLLHTSLAACAVTILKPLQSFSFYSQPSKSSSNTLSVVFAGSLQGKNAGGAKVELASIVQQVEAETGNALLIDLESPGTFSDHTNLYSTYSIVQKGNQKVGVIAINDIKETEKVLTEISETAKSLKLDFGCSLVLCISAAEEVEKIARKTNGIDLFIGTKDYPSIHHSKICRNKNNEEVVVGYTGPKDTMIGRIDFVFNDKNQKININSNPVMIGLQTKDLASLRKHNLLRA